MKGRKRRDRKGSMTQNEHRVKDQIRVKRFKQKRLKALAEQEKASGSFSKPKDTIRPQACVCATAL